MPITGSQKALQYAIVDTTVPQGCRIGATRLDYYRPLITVDLNGTRVQALVIKSTINVQQNAGQTADTASFVIRGGAGVTPTEGQTVVIGLGTSANRLFAGRILRVHVNPLRVGQRFPRYTLNCIDHSWELDHHRSTGQQWIGTSASTIAAEIVAASATTFTARIQVGLIAVDFALNPAEALSSALSRLAALCNASWYVDYDRVIRFFQTNTQQTAPIDATRTAFYDVNYDSDLSQIRNRVIVLGGGAQLTADAAVGATTLHVDSVTEWYASAGGQVLLGNQTVAYTGYTDGADPVLTGVSGVLYAVPTGTVAQVLVTRNNTTLQTALATTLGGGADGVVTHTIQDSSLDVDGATFRGDAELALFQSAIASMTLKTRDKFMLPGRQATVSIASPVAISGTFLVQQVTINGIVTDARYPVREATLAPWQRNLSDLLIQLGATVASAPQTL